MDSTGKIVVVSTQPGRWWYEAPKDLFFAVAYHLGYARYHLFPRESAAALSLGPRIFSRIREAAGRRREEIRHRFARELRPQLLKAVGLTGN